MTKKDRGPIWIAILDKGEAAAIVQNQRLMSILHLKIMH